MWKALIVSVLDIITKLVPLFLMRKSGEDKQAKEQLEAEREDIRQAKAARERLRTDRDYRDWLRDKYGR